MYYNTIQFLLN